MSNLQQSVQKFIKAVDTFQELTHEVSAFALMFASVVDESVAYANQQEALRDELRSLRTKQHSLGTTISENKRIDQLKLQLNLT